MYDPTSMYADLATKDRDQKARHHSKLDTDDWRPDELVKECAEHYINSLELSHNYKAYIAAKRAVHSVGKDLDLFNGQKERIKKRLVDVHKELDRIDLSEDEQLELLKKEEMLTGRMMKLTNNIQGITDKLPDNLSTVEELKKILAQERKQGAEVRGGGRIGRREGRR